MRFGAPGFLPLLAVPVALLLLWFWQLWRRRADARAFVRRRQVPVEERIPFFGELLFWFFLVLAAGAAVLALAKPQAVTSLVRTAGVDLVILQDGSASMHVTDVKGDRWQRSMRIAAALATLRTRSRIRCCSVLCSCRWVTTSAPPHRATRWTRARGRAFRLGCCRCRDAMSSDCGRSSACSVA